MNFIFIILIVFAFFIICNKKEKFMNKNVYKRAANLAIKYIDKTVIKPKSAVMFDIDDTLLFVNSNKLTPISPMIDLLNYCIIKDLLIIIITARSEDYRKQTITDLNKHGINYSYLYLRKSPQDENNLFKSHQKEKLLEEYGITILMSIGDQNVDINGNYSGYCLKLPNKTDPRLFEKYPGKELTEV